MMFLEYRWELLKLNRKKNKIDSEIKKQAKRIRKEKGIQAEKAFYQEDTDHYESWATDEEISVLHTNYLRSVAEKMLLPYPRNITDVEWDKGDFTDKYYLKNEVVAKLRSAIRNEKKERMELFRNWVTILIGLIGAMTGLIAVLKR